MCNGNQKATFILYIHIQKERGGYVTVFLESTLFMHAHNHKTDVELHTVLHTVGMLRTQTQPVLLVCGSHNSPMMS